MSADLFMPEAIRLAEEGMLRNEGGPFGCVIVKEGHIVGRGNNQVLLTHDPTAHAEVVAIRDATRRLGNYSLHGCDLYTSCEPCPMCLGAIYWARIDRIYYACTREDAAEIEFDDQMIYNEFAASRDMRKIPMISLMREESKRIFEMWVQKEDRIQY
jgi:guanine deaminase